MKPDWEKFGRTLMNYWIETEGGEIDGSDVQDWAEEAGILRKESYNPGRHGPTGADYYDLEPGDDWFVPNYKSEEE